MPRPRIYPPDRIQIQIRLPKELRDQLYQEADRREVSTNYLINRAIEQYLNGAEPSQHDS